MILIPETFSHFSFIIVPQGAPINKLTPTPPPTQTLLSTITFCPLWLFLIKLPHIKKWQVIWGKWSTGPPIGSKIKWCFSGRLAVGDSSMPSILGASSVGKQHIWPNSQAVKADGTNLMCEVHRLIQHSRFTGYLQSAVVIIWWLQAEVSNSLKEKSICSHYKPAGLPPKAQGWKCEFWAKPGD